jgi:hypothetical protein
MYEFSSFGEGDVSRAQKFSRYIFLFKLNNDYDSCKDFPLIFQWTFFSAYTFSAQKKKPLQNLHLEYGTTRSNTFSFCLSWLTSSSVACHIWPMLVLATLGRRSQQQCDAHGEVLYWSCRGNFARNWLDGRHVPQSRRSASVAKNLATWR